MKGHWTDPLVLEMLAEMDAVEAITPEWIPELARQLLQFRNIAAPVLEALQYATHEANDYNCEEWPPGTPCAGCVGDGKRTTAINLLKQTLLIPESER